MEDEGTESEALTSWLDDGSDLEDNETDIPYGYEPEWN